MRRACHPLRLSFCMMSMRLTSFILHTNSSDRHLVHVSANPSRVVLSLTWHGISLHLSHVAQDLYFGIFRQYDIYRKCPIVPTFYGTFQIWQFSPNVYSSKNSK